MMLVKREVYENIIHYKIEYNDDYTNLVGEDIYFCELAQEHGYEVT